MYMLQRTKKYSFVECPLPRLKNAKLFVMRPTSVMLGLDPEV